MKSRLRILIKSFLFLMLFIGCANTPVYSQSKKVSHERIDELDELSFTEMINSVPLDEKSAALVRKFQDKEARDRILKSYGMDKNGCNVEPATSQSMLDSC